MAWSAGREELLQAEGWEFTYGSGFVLCVLTVMSHTLADLAANGCPVLSFVAKDFRLEGMQPFSFPANVSVVSVDGDHWQLLQGACVTQLAKSITANPQKKVAKRGGRKLSSKLGSKITKK